MIPPPIYYDYMSQALYRASVGGGAPELLQQLSWEPISLALSPDGKRMIWCGGEPDPSKARIWLAGTAQAGARLEVASCTRLGAFFSDDAGAVVYAIPIGVYTAELRAQAAGGGASVRLGTMVRRAKGVGGARVVLADRYQTVIPGGVDDTELGRADLVLADVAQGPIATLVAGADDRFLVTADGHSLVYTVSGGAGDGLYVLPLP